MDWYLMDSQKYWDIFLETDERFRGIYFKPHYALYPPNALLLRELTMNDTLLSAGTSHQLIQVSSTEIKGFESCNMMHLSFLSDFDPSQKAELELIFEPVEKGKAHFYRHFYVLRFREGNLGEFHRGAMPVPIPDFIVTHQHQVKLIVNTRDTPLEVNEFSMKFFHYKAGPRSL